MRPSQWALQMVIRTIKNINQKLEKKNPQNSYYFNEVKKLFFSFKKGVTTNELKKFFGRLLRMR